MLVCCELAIYITPDQVALCSYMTRVLLPSQLFFVVGGGVSAVRGRHTPELPTLLSVPVIASGKYASCGVSRRWEVPGNAQDLSPCGVRCPTRPERPFAQPAMPTGREMPRATNSARSPLGESAKSSMYLSTA